MDNKNILISLLHWNDTLELIGQVEYYEQRRVDILIIDNGSNEPSIERLQMFVDDRPNIEILWNGENLGFGTALNKGFHYARQNQYEHALYSNNDTRWLLGDLDILMSALHSSDYLLIYPLLHEGNRNCIGGRGLESELNTRVYADDDNQIVDYAPGTLFVIDLTIFDQLDYLDSRYFFGGELAHLCGRMREAHMRFGRTDQVIIEHSQDRSFNPTKTYYNWRNRFIYIRSFSQKVIYHSMRWTAILLIQLVLSLIRVDTERSRTAFYALYHGLSRRVGKWDV